MLSSVSPYALLSACKTQPMKQSKYDLYSIASRGETSNFTPEQSHHAQQIYQSDEQPLPSIPAPSMPQRKTHYISDINTKHNAAMSRTALQNAAIPL